MLLQLYESVFGTLWDTLEQNYKNSIKINPNKATKRKKSSSLESLNLHDHRGLHEDKDFELDT